MKPLPPILVVDIETTCDDRETAGIVEIGALWLDESLAGGGSLAFECKCRPRAHCEIQEEAIKYNGCTWLKDRKVMSETEALGAFASWLAGRRAILAGNNPGFDWHILMRGWKAAQEDIECAAHLNTPAFPFGFRTIDIHSGAVIDAIQAGHGDSVNDDGLKSTKICEVFNVPAEPKPHRAMAGAAWECAVLRKIMGLDPQ